MKLMLADDEKIFGETITHLLPWQEMGFDAPIHIAYDGMEAWEILQKEEIDLFLCDIEMPLLNGLDLQKRIVDHQLKTRTIFLTAFANFQYAQQALRLGVTDYILKPIQEEEFSSTIQLIVREIGQNKMDKTQLKQGGPQSLHSACAFIQGHLDQDLSRDDVAAAVYLNPDYLNRIFIKELGIGLAHYILEEKMKQAKKLLRETTLSVTEVGERSGYTNMSAFSYAFRRYTGTSPTDFRKGISPHQRALNHTKSRKKLYGMKSANSR